MAREQFRIVSSADRRFDDAEIAGFHSLVHEPEQREWDPGGVSLDLPAMVSWFRDVLPKRPGQAVFLAEAPPASDYRLSIGSSPPLVLGMSAVFTAPGRRSATLGFGVSTAWQGRGIGAALVEAAVRHARACGIPRLTAEVLPHNLRAISLLGRAGFSIVTPRRPAKKPRLLAVFELRLTRGGRRLETGGRGPG